MTEQKVVTANGVKILGYTDLPGRLPTQASQLFGTNLVNLLKLLTPGKDGELVLDFEDVVQRGMTVVRDGTVTWPPPPVQVSAAPAVKVAAPLVEKVVKPPMSSEKRLRLIGVAALVKQEMESVYKLEVPLVVETGIGENWRDAK